MSEHKTAQQLDLEAQTEVKKIQSTAEPLKMKDRLAIPAQPMPELEPHYRARSMEEVACGYSEAQAIAEANRCLNCWNRKKKGVNYGFKRFVRTAQKQQTKANND